MANVNKTPRAVSTPEEGEEETPARTLPIEKKKVSTTLSLSYGTVAKADRQAAKTGRSRSQIIEEILAKHFGEEG